MQVLQCNAADYNRGKIGLNQQSIKKNQQQTYIKATPNVSFSSNPLTRLGVGGMKAIGKFIMWLNSYPHGRFRSIGHKVAGFFSKIFNFLAGRP